MFINNHKKQIRLLCRILFVLYIAGLVYFLSSTGACSLAVGIIILATGITAGIMMIINGARLLKKKSEILL